MLCEPCADAIRAAFADVQRGIAAKSAAQHSVSSEHTVHDNKYDFVTSLAHGCFLCRFVWNVILGAERRDPTLVNYELLGKWIRKDRGSECPATPPESLTKMVFILDEVSFELTWFKYAMSWSPSWRYYNFYIRGYLPRNTGYRTPTFLLSPSTLGASTSEALEHQLPRGGTNTSANPGLWRHWIRSCSESHDQCKKLVNDTVFAPSRLVEVLPGKEYGELRWRLTEWNSRTPFTGSYLTLSHCWGPTLHICLQKANRIEFLAENPVSELSKTYQDAMSITRSLGHR